MSESLVETLARLEKEVKELKYNVLSANKTTDKIKKSLEKEVKELKDNALSANKTTDKIKVVNVESEIKAIVTIDFITNLYRNK